MFHTPHVIETALLILVAFLIGCVAGYVARRALAPKGKPAASTEQATAAPAEQKPGELPAAPQLVVAPEIKPIPGGSPKRRSPAERLAAAAGRSPGPEEPSPMPPQAVPQPVAPAPVSMDPLLAPTPEITAIDAVALRSVEGTPDMAPPDAVGPRPEPTMQPARVAGEVTSGIVVGRPQGGAPAAVEPEPPAAPVKAEDVPDIDEADVVDRPVPPAEAGPEPVRAEDVPEIDEAAHVVDRAVMPPPESAEPEEDPEAAAMRAIEGGWSPPRKAPSAGPVPHPEQASAEVDKALAKARSGVAAAAAAAQTALSEAGAGQSAAAADRADAMDFRGPSESSSRSFLDEGQAEPAPAEDGGLEFEQQQVRVAYGRPDGLAEPRAGGKDDLKQIKGVTPALEISLNHLGIFHFDQVAGWDRKAVVWLDQHLSLKGRIGKEKWVEQARDLTRGRPQPPRPVRH